MQEFLNILRNSTPTYILADMNTKHAVLGHANNNNTGNMLAQLIKRGLTTQLGPEFKMVINERGQGTPDIILGNKHANLNIQIKQGEIATSDHLPIYVRLATKPIMIKTKKIMKTNKADINLEGGNDKK